MQILCRILVPGSDILLKMRSGDMELIREFTQAQSQDAFKELVLRHLNLVHSAALRQVQDHQLAEDVAQCVFTELARNAPRLKPDTILPAWLFQVTRRTAIDVIRRESSRQTRERIAAEMHHMNADTSNWAEIAPLLDEAMHTLDEKDHAAMLLRYFENQSLRVVGESLGTSDDAAQKRVSRALERLRLFFANKDVRVSASAFALLLSAHAVQAAPANLFAVVLSSAGTAGTLSVSLTTANATKFIIMTPLKKCMIATAVVAMLGAGVYQVSYRTSREIYPRSSWTFSGFATPEATIKTFMWAKSVGDAETVLAIATPELRVQVENAHFRGKTEAQKAAFLIDNVKQVSGVEIIEKKTLTKDHVAYRTHFDGMPKDSFALLSMVKIDGAWKFAAVEERSGR
jgi:RNA polymerase sigma factor (sigma-70 family)